MLYTFRFANVSIVRIASHCARVPTLRRNFVEHPIKACPKYENVVVFGTSLGCIKLKKAAANNNLRTSKVIDYTDK